MKYVLRYRTVSETNIFDVLETGIRAESLRQAAIGNNVANMATPGYRRLDVKFEDLLAALRKSNGEFDLRDIEPLLYQPGKTPVQKNGNDVNLEMEVGEMIKNTLRHTTLVRVLRKRYQQMQAAMNLR